MKQCLTKEERKALIKDHPRPDSSSRKVLSVDKYTKFLGKRFLKEEDSEQAKVQAAALLPVWHLHGTYYCRAGQIKTQTCLSQQ